MKNNGDPRSGRRPREVVPTSGKALDIGEADGQPIPAGFEDEPDELPADVRARGQQQERDVRAPATASRVERVSAKDLTRS